jgi:hypothetical protein
MSALDLSSEVAPGTDEQQPTAQGPSLTLASMGERQSRFADVPAAAYRAKQELRGTRDGLGTRP